MSDPVDALVGALVGATMEPEAGALAGHVRAAGADLGDIADELSRARPGATRRRRRWPYATAASVVIAGGAVTLAARAMAAAPGVQVSLPWWAGLVVSLLALAWAAWRGRAGHAPEEDLDAAGELAARLLGRGLPPDLAAALARYAYRVDEAQLGAEPTTWALPAKAAASRGRDAGTMVGLGVLACVLLALFWGRYFAVLEAGWASIPAAPVPVGSAP